MQVFKKKQLLTDVEWFPGCIVMWKKKKLLAKEYIKYTVFCVSRNWEIKTHTYICLFLQKETGRIN